LVRVPFKARGGMMGSAVPEKLKPSEGEVASRQMG
jgi:hypothetical protein